MNIESLALGDDALTFRSRVFVESLGSTADALTFGGSVLLEMLSSLRSSVSVDFTSTLLVNMHDLIEVQADQTVASVIGVTILSKLYAHGLPDTETPSEVWVLNAETMGATRYEGFEFNSYAKIGNSYYGCAADGLYLLEGDTDAGDPVRAMVSFGKQDFGTTTLKRISNAYVGLRSDGKLFLKVTVEGSDYLYAARDYDENRKVQRFDIGKGLCANYIEFELYNEDGDDFELASVEFAAVPVSRRI